MQVGARLGCAGNQLDAAGHLPTWWPRQPNQAGEAIAACSVSWFSMGKRMRQYLRINVATSLAVGPTVEHEPSTRREEVKRRWSRRAEAADQHHRSLRLWPRSRFFLLDTWMWFFHTKKLECVVLVEHRNLFILVVYQRSKRSFSVFVQNWHAVYMFGRKLSRVDLTINSMGWIKAHLMRPISGHFSKCLNKTDH
jgi:hypothetical protein